jgi:uncharacterized repeat protein (TIGR01451 family)
MHKTHFNSTFRAFTSLLLCAALCHQGVVGMGMVQPALAQGNAPLSAAADPISIGYGAQTPAGDGVTAFNGEPITYTINIVNLTGATINNISVFNPLPEDTLDSLACSPVCGQSITTRTIPDPLGGVIEVTRTLAVSWFVPALSPGAGAGVQLQLVGRVIGRMAGTSFSSSAIATFDGGAVGSNAVQVTVAARPRNTTSARIETAPVWFSSDAGGTLDQDWGDVNRDGVLDLALASSIGTSVYRNNAGMLTRIWNVPQMSYGVKWADVDGDGGLELVVVGDSDDKTAQTTGRNRIYKFNAGSGSLNLLSEFTSTRQLVRVAVADLNRDGFIDIIGSTNAIAVDCPVPIFLNNGAGQFPVTQTLCLPSSKATAAISLGDMNNDDKPDLALGAFPNLINIRVNGTITTLLQPSSVLTIETGLSFLPYDFSWGDFDADGWLDLAAAFPLERQARIYRNVPITGGRGLALQQILPNPTFMTPLSVDWADVDGDGSLDLVSAGSPSVVYVRNPGTGRFVLKADLGANIGGGQVWEARAAETQIDGGVNLAFTNRDRASMLFDVIAPRLSSSLTQVFGTDVLNASHIALADIDRNGFLDMIQGADGNSVRTRAFLNIDSTFPGFSVFPSLLGPQRIAIADYNSDNVMEVAIGDRTQLVLYTANGNLLRNIVVPANGPFVPAWGDANDDGLLDLFVMSNGPTFVYLNRAGVLENAPSFQTPESCPATPALQVSNRSLAVMDVTGDRFMDLVVGCFGQPARLYRNNRDGTFTLIWSAPSSTPTTDVALDDFNGDGKVDLAIANDGQPAQVYENIGGTFATAPIWNSGANNRAMGLAWGDWNNDGYPELAVASLGAPLDVYANLGSQPGRPQLQRVWRSTVSADFTSVAWGDMDNDGDLDLVSSGLSPAATGLFENTVNQPYQLNTPGNPVQQVDLPRVPAYVALNRPGKTSDAFFNSTSDFLTNPNIANVPITFTVYAPDGSRANALNATVPVQGLVYEYSLDGGSTWKAATPATTTVPITQTTRAGVQGFFLWNARADKAISDNAHFRIRVIAKAPTGPVQRASSSAVTPPFRLRSTTCFWAESASMVYTPTLPGIKDNIGFAAGQIGGSGPITFSWNFGNGVTRIGQLVNMSYTVAGTYLVSLTVTGPACPITRPLTINLPVTVTAGPPVYYAFLPLAARDSKKSMAAMQVSAPAAELVEADLSQQVTGLDGEMVDGQLRLSWQAPQGATPDAYRIYRTAANGERLLLAEVPSTQTNFTDAAPPCSAAYDVTWLRDGEESLPSTVSYFTAPCVVSTKKAATPARVGRFNLTKTTPAAATPAAVLNAPASFAPLAVPAPAITKTCDLPARVIGNPRPSLISINSQPALSAGGGVVAFWSTGNLDPRGLNADGSIELYAASLPPTGAAVVTQVTNSSGSILGGFNLWPSVNGDGTKIAFASDRDLIGQNPESNFETYVAKLGPGNNVTFTQISSTPAGVSLVPSMSADGNHVAFASDGNFAGVNSDRSLEIFIAHLAGMNVVSYTQVTSAPPAILFDLPSISDNGQRVAFVEREFSDVSDVVSQTVLAWQGDLSATTFVTVDVTATDPRPAMSGNGRYVAFVHSDLPEGPYELRMFDLDTNSTAPIASVIRECRPFVSRNGDRVGCVNTSNVLSVFSPARNLVTTGGTVTSNAQPTLATNGDAVAYINASDQVAWTICRSADLALLLPVTNTTPTKAGTVVTMSVPASNLGPSASPTTTLSYTFTSPIGENIFAGGKVSSTVTGTVTFVGNFAANSVYTFNVPLSTTEATLVNMAWHIEGSADDSNPNNNDTTSSVMMLSDVRFAIALHQTSQPTQNVRAGSPITYAIVLTNIGVSRASGVRITDTLPTETRYLTHTASASNAQPVSCVESPLLTLGCLLAGNLPGGGTVALTVTAQVTDTALGPLVNVVYAGSNETIGVVSKTLTTTVLPQADLQIGVVVSPARPVANDVSVYTVFVTNTGRVTVTDANFSVQLPAGALFIPSGNTPWNELPGLIFLLGNVMGPNSAGALTFTVSIPPQAQIGDPLTTTAFITSPNLANGIGGFDPNNTNNTFTHTTTVNRVSDFSIVLDASPAVIAGQPITYAVVFTNAGPSDADVVTVSVSAPLLVPAQVFTITSLTLGMTGTAEFTATVGGGVFTPTLMSTALITSVNSDNNLANNTSAFTSTVTASADVNAQIVTAPTSVIAGERITYTITYSNPGPSDAQNVTVVFSATGALSLTAPAGWTKVNDRQVSLTLPSLAKGVQPNVTITGVVPTFAASFSFINSRLAISSTTVDPNPSNNVDTDSAQVQTRADLAAQLTAPASAVAGTQFAYTVVYSNAGPSDAQNLYLQLTTPFNIASVPAGWVASSPTFATLSLPAFAAGATGSGVITVSVPANAAVGPASANAIISASTTDPNLTNNNPSASVNVTRSADVSISVSAPNAGDNGDVYLYTIVMTNFGPSSLPSQQFNVAWSPAVRELLPATPGWTSAPAAGTKTVGAATFTSANPLPAGGSTTVIVSVITPKKGASLSATFTAATPGAVDPVPGNNSTTKVTSLVTVLINAITLTASSNTVVTGTMATFTVSVAPANATLPLTYTWTVPNIGSFTDVVDDIGLTEVTVTRDFTWTVLGPQTVIVSANNGLVLIASRTITVTPVNLSSVAINAPATSAPVGTAFTFSATVSPANATTPITYTWSATGQTTVQQTGGGTTSAPQSFTWNTVGPQVVTVTATNAGGTVTNTINVNVLPINLTSVSISTPASTQPVGTAFNFTANALPANATTPITYTWSATGQTTQQQTGGGLASAPQSFTWNTVGTQFITVTASNAGASVSASFVVTVTPIALTGVSITPPGSVISGTPASFTANATPVNATLPLTYTWTATNQAGPTVNSNINSVSNVVNYTWPITGAQTVTVVVSNGFGSVVTGTVGVTVP